jgi:hypothetical protein
MTFLDCPAYLDHDSQARCGLPAEITNRYTLHSTDGPVECATIRCPSGHWFNGPIESLTWERTDKHDPGTAAVASSARHDRLTGGHDGRAGPGRSFIQDPGERGQAIRRPNTAPAYYLGRPASLRITAMSPRRSRTATNHLMQAVAGG